MFYNSQTPQIIVDISRTFCVKQTKTIYKLKSELYLLPIVKPNKQNIYNKYFVKYKIKERRQYKCLKLKNK